MAALDYVWLAVDVSFNEHIQPIFSEYCYHCHGPDSGTREPKSEPLRLDRPEDAFALREDGNNAEHPPNVFVPVPELTDL